MRIPTLVGLGLACGLIALSGYESRRWATDGERHTAIVRERLKPGRAAGIPPGLAMATTRMDLAWDSGVVPGSCVDVLVTLPKERESVPTRLLVNMLVLAVDVDSSWGAVVSFAVNRKQAEILSLARKLEIKPRLVLKNADRANEPEANYNIDEVLSRLHAMKVDWEP